MDRACATSIVEFADPRLPDRFWNRVEFVAHGSNCWLWIGARTVGYGSIRLRGRHRYAHRMSYETLVGPIPNGLQIDHLCRNRACVNPSHLEPVTQRENARRGLGASGRNFRKTHCPRGHEYTPANTYTSPQGGRQCRACKPILRRARWGMRVK